MSSLLDLKDPLAQWRAIRDAVKFPEAPFRTADDPRAIANIAQWRELLSTKCVEAMIKDGWHLRV